MGIPIDDKKNSLNDHNIDAMEKDNEAPSEGQIIESTPEKTRRGIKSRHAQMMAIGGAIGTSLFVCAGTALATAGPLLLLMAYLTICISIYGISTMICEVNSFLPVSGASPAYYATRFVSPSLGFALGWLYWYSFGIIFACEITAAAIVMSIGRTMFQ